MSTPLASVIIVSYNTAALTCEAVRSAHASAGHLPIEVMVVDNDSTDGTLQALAALDVAVTVDAVGANIGFGAACNRGAAKATGPYLLLLNPDAELIGDALAQLLEVARVQPRWAIYSGLTERSDGTVNVATARNLPSLRGHVAFALLLSTLFRGRRWADPDHIEIDPNGPAVPVGVVTASFLLIDRALFERLGGFDERYFLYSEEVDLLRRARAAGHQPLLVPWARVRHDAGQATGNESRRQSLMMAGRVTYARLTWSSWRRRVALGSLHCGVALRALAESLPGRSRLWRDVWAARQWWGEGWLAARSHPLDGLERFIGGAAPPARPSGSRP
jgi:GT2 family glycosyltransferase